MDDKTIFISSNTHQKESDSNHTVLLQPGLRVILLDAFGKTTKEFSFTHHFTVGRSLDNDIVIPNELVSRHHLKVKREQGSWWIFDRNSANGIYINHQLVVQKAQLSLPVIISLDVSAVFLRIEADENGNNAEKTLPKDDGVLAAEPVDQADPIRRDIFKGELKVRLLAREESRDAGEYTKMVRSIIHEDRTIQGKSYKKVIWGLGLLFLFSSGLIAFQQVTLSKARTLAIDMFYDIKSLEVSLSQAEIRLEESAEVLELTMKVIMKEKLANEQGRIKAEQEKIITERKRVVQERQKLNSMKARYQQYVQEARSWKSKFSTHTQYEEDLIARVAKGFGESELELPDGFVAEVKRYIKDWQNSSRLQSAMERMDNKGYATIIIDALEKEGVPLYFIYLPLQESNYDAHAIGPETRFGIAKGAWQFLAATGQEYGLTLGPLAEAREYDQHDARFDFIQATQAGAKYLKHIYSTEAQASGLLVMASYNYGHTRVRSMIGKMLDNPRDKNFWRFIQQYEIPKETYDYVFYIFSAAVIGEDPEYFGFRFKPFLAQHNMD